jgi:hypothetical protein
MPITIAVCRFYFIIMQTDGQALLVTVSLAPDPTSSVSSDDRQIRHTVTLEPSQRVERFGDLFDCIAA